MAFDKSEGNFSTIDDYNYEVLHHIKENVVLR